MGVQNDSNNSPSGLTANVENESTGNEVESVNSKREDVSVEVEGEADVSLEIENQTGSQQNANGFFNIDIV